MPRSRAASTQRCAASAPFLWPSVRLRPRAVAHLLVGLGDGFDIRADTAVPQQVDGGFEDDADEFVGRGFGADRIKDFDAEEGDQIHFTGASSMAGLSITDNAFGDRVITLGQSSVILESRAGLVLTASDFIFA